MVHFPDPDNLHTFITVVECGSFTRAAKRIHRTQSAVSMQIRRLENTVGRQLFERLGRSIRLTGDGEILFDHARRILGVYREAMTAFDRTPLEGEITIGLPDDYVISFLPAILARFVALYPTTLLHIISEPSRSLMSRIIERTVDVALLTEGERAGGGIVVHREKLIWVTSAHHQVHKRDPVPLAVFYSSDAFRWDAIGQLEAYGRRARVVVTSLSFAGVDAALEAGVAAAVIFRSSMRPGLRILTPQEGFPDLPDVGIVLHRAEHEPHELADRFVTHVIDSFRTVRSARTSPSLPPRAVIG